VAAPALNDENSSTLHGPLTQLKRLSAAPLQPSKQGSVLKSSRKAFENITNNGKALGSEASAAKAQPQRRAFGDISNSAAKPPTGAVTTKKPQGTSSLFAGLGSKKAGSEAPPAPIPVQGSSQAASVSAADAEANNAAWWEGLEPERPAGKTWEQLEAEREAALEADATRAADEIWQSVTGGGGLFKFLVGWLFLFVRCTCAMHGLWLASYGMCLLACAYYTSTMQTARGVQHNGRTHNATRCIGIASTAGCPKTKKNQKKPKKNTKHLCTAANCICTLEMSLDLVHTSTPSWAEVFGILQPES